MKKYFLLLLIFITLLAACVPQSAVTPSRTSASSNTLPSTASPEPTLTPKSTAIPITVNEILLDSCRQIVEAKISRAGVFEVVFESGEKSSSDAIVSEFGSPEGGLDVNLVLWGEDAQQTTDFPLPPDALGPKISSDHLWILFRRDTGTTQSEFWVTGIDGKAEKKLGTVRLTEEMKARYPDGLFSLDYGWIPNTDTFFYEVDVTYGRVPPLIIDKFVLVDANSGKAIPLAIQSEIKIFRFSPDGSQMAILTESGLRVLSTQDGQEEYTIQASLNDPTYSPDGKYIVDFIDKGILLIEARGGQQQIIPLKYTIMSTRTEGPAYGPLPNFVWVDNSTLLLTSLNSDERYIFSLHKFDPAWTFTVWQVNLTSRTTHPMQTFNGDPSSAKISPNRKLLAFHKYAGADASQTRDLYLADLATGKILETIEDGVFEAWFPDSNKYLYATGIPYPPPGKGDPGVSKIDINYYLGQVDGDPILVHWNASGLEWSGWWWVDQNTLVMNCKIITFP